MAFKRVGIPKEGRLVREMLDPFKPSKEAVEMTTNFYIVDESITASDTKFTDLLLEFETELKSANKKLDTIKENLEKVNTKIQTSNANRDDYEEIIEKLNNTREILIIKIGRIEQKLNDFQNTTNNLDSSIESLAAKLQNVGKSLLELNTSRQNVDEIIKNLDLKMQNFMILFNDTKKGKSY